MTILEVFRGLKSRYYHREFGDLEIAIKSHGFFPQESKPRGFPKIPWGRRSFVHL
jgi:hypothetical protein